MFVNEAQKNINKVQFADSFVTHGNVPVYSCWQTFSASKENRVGIVAVLVHRESDKAGVVLQSFKVRSGGRRPA